MSHQRKTHGKGSGGHLSNFVRRLFSPTHKSFEVKMLNDNVDIALLIFPVLQNAYHTDCIRKCCSSCSAVNLFERGDRAFGRRCGEKRKQHLPKQHIHQKYVVFNDCVHLCSTAWYFSKCSNHPCGKGFVNSSALFSSII